VRDESHLDDMRAAIRGDFERLKERRGEQDLMVPSDDEPDSEPAGEPEVAEEPLASEPQPASEEPRPADEPATPDDLPLVTGELTAPELHPPESDPEPDEQDDTSDDEPAHRTWLDRLLGR
jgi:hypothetical protein